MKDIDFSDLTSEEIEQFKKDSYTLTHGDIPVVLYMRYSSDRQTEQSIEGQLRDCISYCKRQRYRIAGIYVDRATSAHKSVEKRVRFQRMIADSSKRHWNLVIVWKLDRFARNREDSAIYKSRLRRNGVRVESATESVSNTPEGIILESVLEGMAEYYSVELSQKVSRGMREAALKGKSVGGGTPLGYKLVNHQLEVDPLTAPVVQEIFERYANGDKLADIMRSLNERGIKTARGTEFNTSSFTGMLRNERYIGVHHYKDIRVENACPAIISKELWDMVQRKRQFIAQSPARGKAKVNYLLVGKAFCGHCGAILNGESGTGRGGVSYHYYTCPNHKKHKICRKRPMKQETLERLVAEDAMSLLTDDLIEKLADIAMEQSEDNDRIPVIKTSIAETHKGIDNIVKAIEHGAYNDTLQNRLNTLEENLKKLEDELQKESKNTFHIEREHVIYWLERFKHGDVNDEKFRQQLIDFFINSVTVWDEPDGFRITTAYNLTDRKTKTFRVKNVSDTPSNCPPSEGYTKTQYGVYLTNRRHTL